MEAFLKISSREKVSHTGLERREGEKMMMDQNVLLWTVLLIYEGQLSIGDVRHHSDQPLRIIGRV